MNPKELCLPATARVWKGRDDGGPFDRFFKNVTCKDIFEDLDIEGESFSLIGFASDEGVRRNLGRLGAQGGPEELRRRLAPLAYHGPLNHKIYDLGTITVKGDDLESSQKKLANLVRDVSAKNSVSIILGGGHELAWGQYAGLFENYRKPLGVVNIDAHFDIRPLENGRGTSGTSFNQIAKKLSDKNLPFDYLALGIQPEGNTPFLFEVAKQLGADYILAEDIHINLSDAENKLRKFIDSQKLIHATICLDVFAQCFAPGVSAPSPLGLMPTHVSRFVNIIASSKKTVGFGVAELAPNLDQDGITGRLAATLVANFIKSYRFPYGSN